MVLPADVLHPKKGQTPPADVIAAAQKTQRDTGVPASATLGQWSLESNYGKSSPGNNPFGIKAHKGEPSQMLWTHERVKGSSRLIRVKQPFRVFSSMDEAFAVRGNLLSRHYPLAMQHADDPDAFVGGLQADPNHQYATDADYVAHVTKRMRDNDYYQYDHFETPLTKKNNDGSLRILNGEPSVMLGTDQHMAAHVESPHTGGGKVAEGSPSIFVGKQQLAFARYGDATTDSYKVNADVQENVLLG